MQFAKSYFSSANHFFFNLQKVPIEAVRTFPIRNLDLFFGFDENGLSKNCTSLDLSVIEPVS